LVGWAGKAALGVQGVHKIKGSISFFDIGPFYFQQIKTTLVNTGSPNHLCQNNLAVFGFQQIKTTLVLTLRVRIISDRTT
jgi:hypothetical protein